MEEKVKGRRRNNEFTVKSLRLSSHFTLPSVTLYPPSPGKNTHVVSLEIPFKGKSGCDKRTF